MANRIVELPEDSKLNEELIKRLDSFFSAVHPAEFRDTLLELYHNYIIHEYQAYPVNFHQMATQMYLFIDLLGKGRADANEDD